MKKSILIITASLMAIPSISFSQLILTENKSNGLQLKIYISASGDKMKTKSRMSAEKSAATYAAVTNMLNSMATSDPEAARQGRIKQLKEKDIPSQQSAIAMFKESHQSGGVF